MPVLTIGGWSGSVYFSDLVSTSQKRSACVPVLTSAERVADADQRYRQLREYDQELGDQVRLQRRLARLGVWFVGLPFSSLPLQSPDEPEYIVGKQGAGNNIVSPSDSANYLSFLAKLRQTLGTNYIISAAVPVVRCVPLTCILDETDD